MLEARKITEIDLDFVKNYLRIDHEEDDILLNTMLVAAQNFIQSYLNKRFSDYEEIPDEFSIACLALVAHWYENREIQSAGVTKQELSFVFSGLLDLHRDWNKETVADAT
ncbi:head-tail connector protein [Priestia aryabhattai]|uniref:head-tail connector protein n=1 Tax=Priestia aryabhattai TaxID=412384 RepID=UPI002E212BEE|nr:head-tail connector protein [Priestia aryabhattai]MED4261971.1 head-tail connector protein [Priestia aryabhattai]